MQKTYIHIITALFVALVLGACQKDDEPSNASGTPVFYVSGIIDGIDYESIAGVDEHYMFSDYTQDSFNVYSFTGSFSTTDCPSGNCPNTLEFLFRDHQAVNDIQDATPQEVLKGGTSLAYRNILDSVLIGYNLQLFANEYNTGATYDYSWTLSNGATSTDKNPLIFIPITDDSIVEVCFTIDEAGCSSNICYDVYLSNSCYVDFTYNVILSQNSIHFTATPQGGVDPYTYKWEVDQGYDPVSSQVQYQPQGFSGTIEVCVTIEDGNGSKSQMCKNVIVDQNIAQCAANFSHAKSTVYELDNIDVDQLSIVWYDANGKRYSSEKYEQPSTSYFMINEVEDYIENINSQPTSKMDVTFDCWVYGDSESDKIHLEDMEAIIAVAHP